MKRLCNILFMLILFSVVIFPQCAYAADLIIDFSQITGPVEHHATGFEWIFPMNSTVYPYISQLKPNSIKDPWSNEQTAITLWAHKIQWLVGNGSVTKNGSGTHWYPWQDYTAWKTWVTNIVNSHPQTSVPYEWIIWQEPNQNAQPSSNPDVWSGTDQQFFETWEIAVQTIRSLRPQDLIVGPSPVPFDVNYLENFLLFAKANNVLPDVLSWHELMNIGDNPAFQIYGYSPDLIPAHVATMKQFMAANGISINKFDITEYQGSADNYRPGPTAAFIADIERAGNVEGTKGNWGEADQLEGLVTDPNTPQPRSIWWVYKRYADMTGNIVTTTLASAINGLGSYDSTTQTAMVLIGNQGTAGAKTVVLNNIPAGIINGGNVVVTVEQISDTEKSALAAPVVVSQSNQTVSGGSLTISIPNFGAWDAYALTLKNPAGPPTPASIPGDLNGDGKVDIFDYNILVANFGHPYTIFDYNTLVQNYGK